MNGNPYMYPSEYIDLIRRVFLDMTEGHTRPSHVEDLEVVLSTVIEITSKILVNIEPRAVDKVEEDADVPDPS